MEHLPHNDARWVDILERAEQARSLTLIIGGDEEDACKAYQATLCAEIGLTRTLGRVKFSEFRAAYMRYRIDDKTKGEARWAYDTSPKRA